MSHYIQVWNIQRTKHIRNMENRTSLEHGEQNNFVTQRTEQIRNMENRTNSEHGEQNKRTEKAGT
jgi:hypothetical protein